MSHTSQQVSMAPDQGGQEVSSGGGDMTDSLTVTISEVTRIRKRKHGVSICPKSGQKFCGTHLN